jgi:hypothetical protein
METIHSCVRKTLLSSTIEKGKAFPLGAVHIYWYDAHDATFFSSIQ